MEPCLCMDIHWTNVLWEDFYHESWGVDETETMGIIPLCIRQIYQQIENSYLPSLNQWWTAFMEPCLRIWTYIGQTSSGKTFTIRGGVVDEYRDDGYNSVMYPADLPTDWEDTLACIRVENLFQWRYTMTPSLACSANLTKKLDILEDKAGNIIPTCKEEVVTSYNAVMQFLILGERHYVEGPRD